MRAIAMIMVGLVSGAASAGDNLSIDWYSIDAGGTLSASGGSLELQGTIGQFDATSANELSGGSLRLTGGFWGLEAAVLDQIFRDRFESLPISFSTHLAPTFRHPRCTTCHAVAATDFQRVDDTPPGVLPAAHLVVNAATDCTACHTDGLLPVEGTIAPGWQSAPIAFDFRDKTDAELCAMASQPVSGHSPLEHNNGLIIEQTLSLRLSALVARRRCAGVVGLHQASGTRPLALTVKPGGSYGRVRPVRCAHLT